jgi:hypothetical protein
MTATGIKKTDGLCRSLRIRSRGEKATPTRHSSSSACRDPKKNEYTWPYEKYGCNDVMISPNVAFSFVVIFGARIYGDGQETGKR